MESQTIKNKVKVLRSWLKDEELNQCFDFALSDLLAIKYPSDNNRPKVEDLIYDFTNSLWLQKRMLDIIDRAGGLSVTSYKENGLSLTYGASYIDPQLASELTPKAGVPR